MKIIFFDLNGSQCNTLTAQIKNTKWLSMVSEFQIGSSFMI